MIPSCLNCWHFPVCEVKSKARKLEAWNHNLVEFYQKEAESCDFYDPEARDPPRGEQL